MKFARVVLALAALMLLGFGMLLLVHPEALRIVGIDPFEPAGRIELRAFYGGVELGLAAFLVLGIVRADWVRPALTAQAFTLGAVAAARSLALLLDATRNPVIYASLAVEVAGTLLAVLALWRLRRNGFRVRE